MLLHDGPAVVNWAEKWQRMDPMQVLMRKQAQQQRKYENSKEGKSMIALAKMEKLFTPEAEPLFSSAHAAIVFALNYNHQQYDKPLMNRLAMKAMPQGKGLSGIDGAAQAGMIRGMIGKLSDLECAMLIAYCAPKKLPIPGNHGDKMVVDNKIVRVPRWSVNPEYQRALYEVANSGVIQIRTMIDQQTFREIRLACVARCFGEQVNLQEVATKSEKSYPTVKRVHREVREYLLGRNGAGGEPATLGAIQQAMNRAESLFRESGLID